ncbi:putative apoptosis-inducing factor 1, mitochondrial isoform X2 [Culex quinquefasciatus]|uniref:putative apoptosis-inducing factor 1, mitochondrial isoform X2 n=1 Tax=Culex quinquefasciatus TaxID=7176 RepID=UPI0018E2C963|nr:putative apoptosis-inducing factor 1, mitochondrial isoform X2 [Culex quinquefasciatus]
MINPEMEPLKYKWNDSERSISYEPDDLCIDPTKLDEAQNEGVAIARSYEVQPNDVENLKLIRELQVL